MKRIFQVLYFLSIALIAIPTLTFGGTFSKYPHCPLIKLSSEWKLLELYPDGESVVRATYGKPSTHMRGITVLISGEPTEISLDAYGRASKKAVELNPKSTWTRLGKVSVKGQKGILAEVIENSAFGNIKMLQWMTIKDSFAYVITIGSHESEFSSRRKELMDVIYSIELKDSPLDWLTTGQKSSITSVFEELIEKVKKISLRGLSAKPAPGSEDANVQTCSSVLLDTLPEETQNEKTQELMQAFFTSEAFQKELWPMYTKMLSKHFKSLGPAWETEMQIYIASRYFGY